MTKITKFLTLVMCFLLFFINSSMLIMAHSNLDSSNSKIDSSFPTNIFRLSKEVPVIVELIEEPVVPYSFKLFNNQYYFKKTNFSSENFDTNYEINLIQNQNEFLNWLNCNDINVKIRARCTYVVNSISLDVKGWDIPRIIKNPNVKKVHYDNLIFHPYRAIAAQTTGAYKVWKGEGVSKATGKGVLVGVIDSGIDKNHPEFKGKIKGGYDLADGDGDFQDSDFHGTMVSGIIGGLGDKDYLRGMGYDVNFMIYKVFSEKFKGGREIIPAIDRAVADRCDIINLSLGSPGPFDAKGNTIYHTAVRNATKANVMVVCATGNEGSVSNLMPSPIGPPAGIDEAFAVACSDDRCFQLIKVLEKEKFITGRKVPFSPPFKKELTGTTIVDCGYGKKEDFENVAGKIALIKRGPIDKPISFRDKILNAKEAGAKAIIIYNYDSTGLIVPSFFEASENPYSIELIPSVFITKEDGDFLISILDKNPKLSFEEGSGVTMADYTSMGPTADACFKPEISAPGSYIYTTYPEKDKFYGMGHGTSSASPMAAGLVALIKEVQPKWKTDEIKSALMNTATILKNPFNGKPITFLLQGAGEADVKNAINTPCFINPQAVVIENTSSKTIEFTLKNISNEKSEYSLGYEVFLEKEDINPLKIDINPTNITLNSGSSLKFSAKFAIEKSKFKKSRVEGIIKLGELHIPFVVFNDNVDKVPKQISNIKIDPENLYFKDSKEKSNINISFSLNYGDKIRFKDIDAYNYASNYGDVKIVITDKYNEEWSTISNLSGYLIGDYKIKWDGRNKDGLLFLPEGKYYLQFFTKEMIVSNAGNELKESVAEKVAFEVKQSIVPEPSQLILSCLSKYKLKEDFLLNLYVNNNNDFKLKGLEISINYDAKRLSCKEVLLGSEFASPIDSEEDNKIISEIYDDLGIVNIKILKKEAIENNERIKIASIHFKGVDIGKLKFKCINSFFLVDEEYVVKIKPVFPAIEITDKNFLLADLNNDKKTDISDLSIFSASFGSTEKDNEYKEICDFNQDKIVDLEDLITISKEFGSSI